MNWTTLVSAEQLAAQLGRPELRLVDTRFVLAGADPEAGERAWRASHLPGAGYVHLDRDLSDHRKPASFGRHPLPEATDFCETLERLGISPGSQVVVYDAADGAMAAARFWWLLKLLGHENVAVLDGGFARWTTLDLPLESSPPTITRGHYHGEFDRAMIADSAEIQRRAGELPGWLVDIRAAERFRGDVEPLDRVAGHIPGAVNRPFSQNMRDGVFLPARELRDQFTALLAAREPGKVVLQCGSGVTACQSLLAMEYAGLHGARVYAGSYSGWCSDPARPIVTGA